MFVLRFLVSGYHYCRFNMIVAVVFKAGMTWDKHVYITQIISLIFNLGNSFVCNMEISHNIQSTQFSHSKRNTSYSTLTNYTEPQI